MPGKNLVVVMSYGSRAEAELAKGALEAAGIEAMTQADSVGCMREHLAWSGEGFQILVREEDATTAREVLTLSVSVLENGGDQSPDADSQTNSDSPSSWRRFT
jgi:hypothetical protein